MHNGVAHPSGHNNVCPSPSWWHMAGLAYEPPTGSRWCKAEERQREAPSLKSMARGKASVVLRHNTLTVEGLRATRATRPLAAPPPARPRRGGCRLQARRGMGWIAAKLSRARGGQSRRSESKAPSALASNTARPSHKALVCLPTHLPMPLRIPSARARLNATARLPTPPNILRDNEVCRTALRANRTRTSLGKRRCRVPGTHLSP